MDVIYRTIKAQYEFAAAKAVQVENLARSFRELKLGIYISLKFHWNFPGKSPKRDSNLLFSPPPTTPKSRDTVSDTL